MRIAYFSPLPPQRTGVSDYSEELLPHLARWAEVDLFLDSLEAGHRPTLKRRFQVYDYQDFERYSHQYQACLYHLGNDPSHEYVLQTMLRYPSFAVLHDVSLHPLVVALTVGRGNLVGYMREMGYGYGREGVAEARSAYVGRCFRYEEYPLAHRVVDLNLGVIVHSQYAAHMVRSIRPQTNLAIIPHGTHAVRGYSRQKARQRLGLDAGEFVLASLGFVTPHKRLEVALGAFQRLLQLRPQARFFIVGEVPPWYDLAEAVNDMNLAERVTLVGRVPMGDFYAYAAAADVCLSLRYPTSGETSGALLRAMSVGRPVVVSNVGSFAELPDDACFKVPVGEVEEDELLAALERLAGDKALRRAMGRQARAYVARHHAWPSAAQAYFRFIEGTLAGLRAEKVS